MDNLNLENDESVLYRTQKLIISGVGHEAVLTEKRLILIGNESQKVEETIPYTDIGLAAAGTNALREPIITLTMLQSEGGTRESELIFIHRTGGEDVRDRDRCLSVMEQHQVTVRGSPSGGASLPLARRDNAEALPLPEEEEKTRPAVPEMSIFGMARGKDKAIPEESTGQSSLAIIAVVFVIFGLLIAGIFLTNPGTGTGENPFHPSTTAPTPAPTPEAQAAAPQQSTAPVPTETTRPAWVLLPGEIPPNGIWVRVTYPGTFTGTLRAKGWNADVNSSGTFLYQLPVHDTTIEGTIDKGDGSANTMDIEIFNGGALVSKLSTSKPYGSIELHESVGSSVISRPEITAAPTIVSAIPTPDTSLELRGIPISGVWVRVAYPGNFTGTLTGNGIQRDVNSSGDQFYQLPVSGGLVGAFVEKSDGSEKNMLVEVYKDGNRVTYGNTTTPLGIVEIHTTV